MQQILVFAAIFVVVYVTVKLLIYEMDEMDEIDEIDIIHAIGIF
jgi:hypothetical protein